MRPIDVIVPTVTVFPHDSTSLIDLTKTLAHKLKAKHSLHSNKHRSTEKLALLHVILYEKGGPVGTGDGYSWALLASPHDLDAEHAASRLYTCTANAHRPAQPAGRARLCYDARRENITTRLLPLRGGSVRITVGEVADAARLDALLCQEMCTSCADAETQEPGRLWVQTALTQLVRSPGVLGVHRAGDWAYVEKTCRSFATMMEYLYPHLGVRQTVEDWSASQQHQRWPERYPVLPLDMELQDPDSASIDERDGPKLDHITALERNRHGWAARTMVSKLKHRILDSDYGGVYETFSYSHRQ